MRQLTQLIFLLACILGSHQTFGQSSAITIDGFFDDWDPSLVTFTDDSESINGIDILEFQVTNDDQFLFVKIKLDQEIDLTEATFPHNLMMYIDTDNDAETGFGVQTGFGSEIGISFVNLMAFYDVIPASEVNFSDIKMRPGPTVSGDEFEIAIGRAVIPDGVNLLFPSPTIKISFKEWTNGDNCPNNGQLFEYTFDETPVDLLIPTEILKEDPELIRVMAYNTLGNGLSDANRQEYFERITSVIDPDVIGFSESNGVSASTVKSILDAWLPLGTEDGWYTIKNGDLVGASKWPFIDSWTGISGQFPTLIDLPIEYGTDLLLVNAHWSCCGNNAARQNQADAFCAFMLDAKSEGGIIDLPPNTPMVYVGDLNLVGYAQQLITLVTGDVIQEEEYGPGGPLDWDGTDLKDQVNVQTDKRMAYTWRDDSDGNWPPGRLDFIVYTDAVMDAVKSFTLQTEIMSATRLQQYGFEEFDTMTASDHFPVVADFAIYDVADADGDGIIDELDNCIDIPNTDQADWNNNAVGDECEDTDGDGLTDAEELMDFGTDPNESDTDNDGLTDGDEVNVVLSNPLVQDTDGDGLTDGLEWNDGTISPTNPDSDGDGCNDADEYHYLCDDFPCGDCPGDLNNDGLINVSDLILFLTLFGSSCE